LQSHHLFIFSGIRTGFSFYSFYSRTVMELIHTTQAPNGQGDHTFQDEAPDMPAAAWGRSMERLQANIAAVLLGKPEVIRMAVAALLADGHVLIEDVPGVGKTLLAKALARSLDCSFQRIQFTPDLLPSDLIGTSVFHQPSGEFIFKPGPLFANLV